MRLVIALQPPRLLVPPPESSFRILTTIQALCYRIVTASQFSKAVGWLVVGNIIVLSLKHKGQSAVFTTVEDAANNLFTTLFTIEAAVLIAGLGPQQYFARGWNCFDFTLVVGSVASAVANQSSVGLLLRVFRILRVFRLVKLSRSLKQLGRTLLYSLPSFFNIMLILCMSIHYNFVLTCFT